MRKLGCFFILTLCSSVTVLAQIKAGIVKGKLADTLFKESMAEATVSVLTVMDSSVVVFSSANPKGEFEIKAIDTGSYQVKLLTGLSIVLILILQEGRAYN